MGSVGNRQSTESYNDFSGIPVLSDNMTPGQKAVAWWREHTEMSNTADWMDNLLTEDEADAVKEWTGSGYWDLADLYTTEWDDMQTSTKEFATDLFNAVNKFELKQGITVNRSTDFQIFGRDKHQKMTEEQVRNFLKNETDNGLIQNDGFMSFSTRSAGVKVAGSGLVIHLNVPPNKGAGAYVSAVGGNKGEREYMTNNNSIMRFDANSVRTDENGYIHVNAKLVGQSKMQTIDSKNKSKFRKEPVPFH